MNKTVNKANSTNKEKLQLLDCSIGYLTDAEKQKVLPIQEYVKLVIQQELNKYFVKPQTGIPRTDLDASVNSSLDKADSAIQQEDLDEALDNIKVTIEVDKDLNKTSTNPVENKIITEEIDKIIYNLQLTDRQLNDLEVTLKRLQLPTKTSQLVNDSQFVSRPDLATVAFTGDYNSLKNVPTPTSVTADAQLDPNSTRPIQNKAVYNEAQDIRRLLRQQSQDSVDLETLQQRLQALQDTIQELLNQKQDTLTDDTLLGKVNGRNLFFGGSIYIPTGGGSSGPTNGISIAGEGSLHDAYIYANENPDEYFQWYLRQENGSEVIRKVIWFIPELNKFIDAIGSIMIDR